MRNQTVIRTLIREMLNERDRFSKEKGRDFDTLKDRGIDINKMAKQELAPGVPLYYFNMSNDFVPIRNKRKEKITPMAKGTAHTIYASTPVGYYVYPLTPELLTQFKTNKLPLETGSQWITIIKALSTENMLNVGKPRDRQRYENLYSNFRLRDDIIPGSGIGGTPVARPMTLALQGKKTYSQSFKKVDYTKQKRIDWVYDPGEGVIYEVEPTQAVFLTTKAFEVVDKFHAKEVFASVSGTGVRYRSKVHSDVDDEKEQDYGTEDSKRYTDFLELARTTTDPGKAKALLNHPHHLVRKAAERNPLNAGELKKRQPAGFAKISNLFEAIVSSDASSFDEFRNSFDSKDSIKEVDSMSRSAVDTDIITTIYNSALESTSKTSGASWKDDYFFSLASQCAINRNATKELVLDFIDKISNDSPDLSKSASKKAAISYSSDDDVGFGGSKKTNAQKALESIINVRKSDDEILVSALDSKACAAPLLLDVMGGFPVKHKPPARIKAIQRIAAWPETITFIPMYDTDVAEFITKNSKKLSSDPEFIKALKLIIATQSPFRNSNLQGKSVAAAEKILSKGN